MRQSHNEELARNSLCFDGNKLIKHLCYVGKTQIHEDLGVPTQSFWCRGASQCSSSGRYLCCPRIDQIHVRRFFRTSRS